MLEREIVIKALECCILGNKHEPDCDVCPYSAGCNDTCDTMDEIHSDALALLKAQEPVKPLKMAVDHVRKEPVVFSYECPVCMCGLQRHWVACPICGTVVKFE